MSDAALKMDGPVLETGVARQAKRPDQFREPNAETRAAMEELRRGDLPVFESVEELMADLNADD